MTVLTGQIRGATNSIGSITSIATIAALRALTTSTGPDSPEYVIVDGYYTSGDGGGGLFKCVPGGNAAAASFTAAFNPPGGGGGGFLVVTAKASGYISVGDVVSGTSTPSNFVILQQVDGTPGGVGNYFMNYYAGSLAITSRGMASTSDNGATCFVDTSGRRWLRQWDGTGFDVRWAGIFYSNTDNGPLIGRLPKYVNNYFQDGIYQFASYPSFSDLFVAISRGSSTVFNCTGALGQYDLNAPAFTWDWGPTPFHSNNTGSGNIQYGTYDSGKGMSVMVGAGVSPMEGISILGQFDGSHGVGLQLGYPGNDFGAFTPMYTRPKNLTVGGFYCNVIYGPSTAHVYLTGLDESVMRGGGIGYRYDNYPNNDSGENMSCRRSNFNGHYGDGVQLVRSQRQDFDICSLTYNHRAAYITGTPCFFSSYFETNIGTTPDEVLALDENANVVFTSRTNFIHFARSTSDFIQFGGTPGSRGSQVFFERCEFFDTASSPVPAQQFLQQAGLQIFGSLTGFNGVNFPPCVSPNQCMQPDYNFASTGLTFYPGSSGCTNQASVVHSPQTRAVALTGSATLQFSTMDVKPGELIYVTMYDKLTGTISTLAGSMVFTTADGITVATTSFSKSPSVADWHYNPVELAPSWDTSARDWTLEAFVFRVPTGASKMTGSLSTTNTGTYYVSELAIYHQ